MIVDLKSWRFSKRKPGWIEDSGGPEPASAERLRVMTYNVWFGDYMFDPRAVALLSLARDYAPDIIGLQEVTPRLLTKILEADWVREHYFLSDTTGTSVTPYGTMLLSRFPLRAQRLYPLPSGMHRQMVTAEVHLNGQILQVANVHLESKKHNASMRAAQLRGALKLLEHARHCLLVGDFNFCSSWPEENSVLPAEYQDLWPALRPEEPGYTVDTEVNLMRLLQKDKRKANRFDRILLRGRAPGWQARSIELIGIDPISPQYVDVFPSDHFGLVADLQWDAGMPAVNQ